LVVTIVVLLILAGVSISLILDNNGIIQKSKDARRGYREVQINEQMDIDNVSDWISEVTDRKEQKVVEPENIADWEYTEEDDGTVTLHCYKGNDTKVIIPNYINKKPVKKTQIKSDSSSGSFWASEICSNTLYGKMQETITEVVISDGIQELGEYTFVRSRTLEKVTIPDSVRVIGNNVFAGCSKLSDVIIGSGVTTIGQRAFINCTNLSNVIIPNSVAIIENNAFEGCNGLQNIDIPPNITKMGSAVFNAISSITVNVSFKKGEQPSEWDANWNQTSVNCVVTVNYSK
jgi:hypothetical protein